MYYRSIAALTGLGLTLWAACSSKGKEEPDAGSPDGAVPEPDAQSKPNLVAVVGNDYVNPGELRVLDVDASAFLPNPVFTTHSDAVVRAHEGQLYVVNRFGGDSVQCLDPESGLACSAAISTGANSNPQDILFFGASAFVSRYGLGDLAKIDWPTGQIVPIPLAPFAEPDGDVNPLPASLLKDETSVYAAFQDLQSDFSVNTFGKIAVVDPADAIVTGVMTLASCYNPVSMEFTGPAINRRILVSCAGSFTQPEYKGSVVVVNPETQETERTAITAEKLKGNPGEIEVSSDTLYVVAGFPSQVQRYALGSFESLGQPLYQNNGFISTIAWFEGAKTLLVATQAGVVFVTHDGEVVGNPVIGGLPPSSITVF